MTSKTHDRGINSLSEQQFSEDKSASSPLAQPETQPGSVFAAPADDNRSTTFALAALASAVFLGSQLLAHASVSALGIWDLLVAMWGTVAIGWLYREQLRDQPIIAKLLIKPKAQRILASPEVLILPVALALLSVVPTLERNGQGPVGLGLRLIIGVLVVASVSVQVPSWLAMASLVTIVFHPWDHPIGITAIFTGLALLVLGLANLAHRPMHPVPAVPAGSAGSSGSIQRRRQQHWSAVLLIAVAIGGALILEPTARKITWRSNDTEFGQGNATGSTATRSGNFRALSRSASLELAYRPTRSTEVVLRVYTRAQAPVFLRTQTFDTWTGKTWTEAHEPQREVAVRVGLWEARPGSVEQVRQQVRLNTYNPEAVPRGLMRTVVQAQTKLNGVVPVPTEALGAIWMLDGADTTSQFLSSTMFWRTDGTASTVREKGASPIYTVLHDTRVSNPIDDGQTSDHQQLLSAVNISSEVRQLAQEIAGTGSSSAEKVQRIRSWMTSNIRYNLTAKDPGSGADPIDYLLFTSREGSCTHFATATAALLRSVGVPTRISTGFVAQEQPRLSKFVVRGRDAHAWAEVPLVAGGWLPVDTTIGAREVIPSSTTNRSVYRVLAVAVFLLGTLFGAAIILKPIVRRRGRPTPNLLAAEIVRLARRLEVRVPSDCSTAKLAQILDARLSTGPASNRPASKTSLNTPLNTVPPKSAPFYTARSHEAPSYPPASTRPFLNVPVSTSSWRPGILQSFGQRLEASTFGPTRVDLDDGKEVLRAAFRQARSQRWARRRLQMAYLVRVQTRDKP
jgi:transglutaminase-like putative cysteine protease